ncbi:hypothetical protein [Psychroflexus torquis]|uniref:hypothetical protein n=1 Tax=Psychroflexus torquis TaxID=57029 RepID=UPI001FDED5EB|nr:hypothetical protein [Psychroflexus torquis]
MTVSLSICLLNNKTIHSKMKSNFFLVLIVFLLISCKQGNNSELKNAHTEGIENLYFSKVDFKTKKITSNNYSNSFTLNTDKFLSIQFTLDKPLVYSLQLLAPNLTQDQLLNKGNFQFSFLVDGEVIYVENLNKGAGLKATKTEQLKHVVPLAYPAQIDYWGWFMWLKFMKLGGGQDVLTKGSHSLSVEVRPYIQEDSLIVGPILAKGKIAVEVARIPVDESLVPLQQIQPNSGWKISNGSFDKSRIEALNRKIAEKRFENINGIVVIKENKLLIEEYFNGENRSSLHNPRSVGKSIASTMMGIAIEEKFIKMKLFY